MRRISTLLVALAALALAACGGDSDPASDAATPAAEAAGTFPVTVEQKLGEVTIDAEPKRVVALDYPSADAAIALGVVPVGMAEVTYVDGGIQEWTKAALGGAEVELFNTDQGFPLETIQRLRPDVILATNTYPLIEERWDELNRIAPVVGHVEGPGIDTWQQGVRQVAKALGREEAGERLIADVEAKIAQAREDHPEFEGKTVSFFNYVGGDGLYVINEEADVSIKFLTELGFAGLTDRVAAMKGESGRAKVSAERYRDIEADVILGTSTDPAALEELQGQSLFQRVPAVERGAFVDLGIGPATAMAFPSALSVPYAVEQLADRLAEAVAAR